jgi:hypothetical protein
MQYDTETGAIGFPIGTDLHDASCCASRGCHAVCSHGCGSCSCFCHDADMTPRLRAYIDGSGHFAGCLVQYGTRAACEAAKQSKIRAGGRV